MKKLIALLVALTLLSASLAGASAAESALPLEEPVYLTAYWNNHGYCKLDSWNDYPTLKALAEATNIIVDYTPVNSEQISIAVNTDSMPDMFIACGGVSSWDTYGANGSVLALEDLIAGHAPNIAEKFAAYPAAKGAVTAYDGHIYTLPFFNMIGNTNNGNIIHLNTAWLEASGLESPKTVDEFTALLEYFRDNDMNGNGDPGDEIPFSSNGRSYYAALTLSWFGEVYSGAESGLFTIDENYELRPLVSTDGYRAYVEYLRKLYSEELLDKGLYTKSNDEFYADRDADRIGAISFSYIGSDYTKWQMAAPLTSEINDTQLISGAIRTGGGGGFAISASNKDPEASIMWADVFFRDWDDDFGGVTGIFCDYGVKGLTWDVFDETANEIGYTFTDELAEGESSWIYYLGYKGPGGMSFGYLNTFELATADVYTQWVVDNYMVYEDCADYARQVPLSLRYDEMTADRKSILATDINTALTEREAAFISGERELNDETWREFIDELNALGLEEYYGYVKEALERYNA